MEENEKKQENAEQEGFDFAMFIGDEGANVLSSEQLETVKKQLPKWNITPPPKYKKK